MIVSARRHTRVKSSPRTPFLHARHSHAPGKHLEKTNSRKCYRRNTVPQGQPRRQATVTQFIVHNGKSNVPVAETLGLQWLSSRRGRFSRVGKICPELPKCPIIREELEKLLVLMNILMYRRESGSYLPNPNPTSRQPSANDPVPYTRDPSCRY